MNYEIHLHSCLIEFYEPVDLNILNSPRLCMAFAYLITYARSVNWMILKIYSTKVSWYSSWLPEEGISLQSWYLVNL